MGKSTISMVIFNSYVKLPEGIPYFPDETLASCKHWVDLEHFREEKVTAAWTSEMFLKYCEQCAYDVP